MLEDLLIDFDLEQDLCIAEVSLADLTLRPNEDQTLPARQLSQLVLLSAALHADCCCQIHAGLHLPEAHLLVHAGVTDQQQMTLWLAVPLQHVC